MSDFRFKGIDGRGNVKLAQDPRNNNSIAVIRIDDPKAGSEGYTFDIAVERRLRRRPDGGFAAVDRSSAARNLPTTSSPVVGNRGVFYPGRARNRSLSAERAIDLCRTELRARGERDYGLRNIDITAAAVDTNQGRRDWITGTFNDTLKRSSTRRRAGGNSYRFNCAVDYNSGQVRTIEISRADGSAVQPLSAAGTTATSATGTYDQNQAFRACQDAVVARTNRDGYQNVNFSSTAIDTNRSGRIAGTITASRGPVTDTFDFGCSMDLSAARVNNVELNRR